MRQISVHNPFNAPVYHEDTVDTTMSVSRILVQRNEPHGTVISAGFQTAGRGRIKGRSWDMEKGSSLAFTILLRFSDIEHIPQALTLRAGLAVSHAIEDFAPALAAKVLIKWPNDILISGKKTAGILTESDGGNVRIGIGVNVGQRQFPASLQNKSTSISLAAGREITNEESFTLLEKILVRLYTEIEPVSGGDWRRRIEERLYKKGGQVCFAAGAANSGKKVTGILFGIGQEGELLIQDAGQVFAFTTGELILERE